MSRWRCCNSEGCTLAINTGSDWTSSGGYSQWVPTGPFTGQALPTWYVEITLTETSSVLETWLDLVIDDPDGEIPFSLGAVPNAGRLELRVNNLVIGFVSPIPAVKRFLIGIENYRLPVTDPRRVNVGVIGFDENERQVFSIVRPLREDVVMDLKFTGVRTELSPESITEAKLGRMRADALPCCPSFWGNCLAGSAETEQVSRITTYAGFTPVFDSYSVDVVTDSIDGAEILLEFCVDACADPDGYYRVLIDIDGGKAYLQWVDCGHSGAVGTAAQASFSVPQRDADNLYRFHVCVMTVDPGGFGPYILVQVGLSKTLLSIRELPFEYLTDCLRSATFTEEYFATAPIAISPHLRRVTHVMVTHHFDYSAQAQLFNQRIGCDCWAGYEGTPAPIACHGYNVIEVPTRSVKARLDINKLPMLTRPADQNNEKVFYPLSFANGSNLPTIGIPAPFCWVVESDPAVEFSGAWHLRNPATPFALKSAIQLCEMAIGVLCWGYYPPPPDAFYAPLLLLEGYTLEWAAYTVTHYILAGETQIRDANAEGWTFLLFRFRARSKDSPEMRFWYCTPEPVPFPLLRPSPEARLPPVASRTFALDGSGFAGLVLLTGSPEPDATQYIRDALSNASEFAFTVIFDP